MGDHYNTYKQASAPPAAQLHPHSSVTALLPHTPTTCMISGTSLNPNEQSRWATRQPGLPYAWRGSSSPGTCHHADYLSDACWSQAAGLGDGTAPVPSAAGTGECCECWLSPHTDCPLSPLPCWHTQDALCSGANCTLDHPTAAKRTYRRGSLLFSYSLKLPGAPACARAFAHCWH